MANIVWGMDSTLYIVSRMAWHGMESSMAPHTRRKCSGVLVMGGLSWGVKVTIDRMIEIDLLEDWSSGPRSKSTSRSVPLLPDLMTRIIVFTVPTPLNELIGCRYGMNQSQYTITHIWKSKRGERNSLL